MTRICLTSLIGKKSKLYVRMIKVLKRIFAISFDPLEYTVRSFGLTPLLHCTLIQLKILKRWVISGSFSKTKYLYNLPLLEVVKFAYFQRKVVKNVKPVCI